MKIKNTFALLAIVCLCSCAFSQEQENFTTKTQTTFIVEQSKSVSEEGTSVHQETLKEFRLEIKDTTTFTNASGNIPQYKNETVSSDNAFIAFSFLLEKIELSYNIPSELRRRTIFDVSLPGPPAELASISWDENKPTLKWMQKIQLSKKWVYGLFALQAILKETMPASISFQDLLSYVTPVNSIVLTKSFDFRGSSLNVRGFETVKGGYIGISDGFESNDLPPSPGIEKKMFLLIFSKDHSSPSVAKLFILEEEAPKKAAEAANNLTGALKNE